MTLNSYGSIAEIFSGFAILITLAYGIWQLRINNRLARVQLTQVAGTGLHEFYMSLGRDADAARIWRDGLSGNEDLSPDERTQFTLLCTAGFIGFEMQFRLQSDGLIASEFFDRGDQQMEYMMRQPGILEWWPRHRMNFSSDFAVHLDKYFAAAAQKDPVEALTEEAPTLQTSP